MSEYDSDDGFDPAFASDPLPSSSSFSGTSLGALGDLSNAFGSPFSSPCMPSTSVLSFSQEEEEDHPAPLGRSRGAAAGAASSGNSSSNRLSLAFELASAGAPGRGDRDLLRELGIEEGPEEEEEGEGDEEEEGEEDSGYGATLEEGRGALRASLGVKGERRRRRSATSVDQEEGEEGWDDGAHSSPGRSTTTTTTTAATTPTKGFESPLLEREREKEGDDEFEETERALKSSVAVTDEFLAHLREHTSSEPSNTTQSTKEEGEGRFVDRQPKLESLATNVVKRIEELAKRREKQLRELSDLERGSLKVESKAHFPSSISNPSSSPPLSPSNEEREAEEDSLSTHPCTSTARLELSNLKDVTTSLIHTLSSLHEYAQMTSLSIADTSRKLRALRGHLGAAREEMASVRRSEQFVRDWERGERRKGEFAERARSEVTAAGWELEEGWRRAREVLVVH